MQCDPEQALRDREVVERIVASVLAERWPGAGVATIRMVPADASSRRYLRCDVERGSTGADAPASVVVMLMEDAALALSSDELAIYGDQGPDELPFINIWRFLSARIDALPEIYASSQPEGWIVLEDLGDIALWDAASTPGGDAEGLFAAALELLARLQSVARDDGSGCYAFAQAFDQRLFAWEFDHFLEYGLEAQSAGAAQACRRELQTIAERLGDLPKVFCHRDYHAWNIHVHEQRLRILDFQDALMAPRLYDVASLLTDRRTPEIVDTQMERRLVLGFADAVGRNGLGSDEETLEIYRLCALQRVLKVVGRFNYLAEVKGRASYLELLPRVVCTATRLLDELPGLQVTRELLKTSTKAGSGATP